MEKQFWRDFPLIVSKKSASVTPLKPYTYLDNAATTHKPSAVFEAIEGYYLEYNANPYRGTYSESIFTTRLYESARAIAAQFICAEPDELIFTRNATEALNLVAYSYALNKLRAGDKIALPISEHHSNLVVWQQICRKTGAELVYMYPDENGYLNNAEIERTITKDTKLVACAHASNVLGVLNPIKTISERSHQMGAVVVLDCTQSIAHAPLSVRDLDVDFAAFSGHKMYAPMGIGTLYVKKEMYDHMEPLLYGGEMIDEVFEGFSTFKQLARQFEAGTPNVEGALALVTAMNYLLELGFDTIRETENELTRRLLEGMNAIESVKILGNTETSDDRLGIVSFVVKGTTTEDIAMLFKEENICIRTGSHCAQPLHRYLGIESSCRVSPCFYNTPEEIDRFLEVIAYSRRNISRRIMTFFP